MLASSGIRLHQPEPKRRCKSPGEPNHNPLVLCEHLHIVSFEFPRNFDEEVPRPLRLRKLQWTLGFPCVGSYAVPAGELQACVRACRACVRQPAYTLNVCAKTDKG
jgi:hypothetical protein